MRWERKSWNQKFHLMFVNIETFHVTLTDLIKKSLKIEKSWLINFLNGGRYFSASSVMRLKYIQVTFVSHHHEAYVSSMNFLFNQTFSLIQELCIMASLTNCWNFKTLTRFIHNFSSFFQKFVQFLPVC